MSGHNTREITILDYGVGNLASVARAIEKVGGRALLVSDGDAVRRAEKLILPGVGAFGDCARALEARDRKAAVLEFVATGRPMLGICVGMQLLFEASHEFGTHPGLGIVAGAVTRIDTTGVDGGTLKAPHIGWSGLVPPEGLEAAQWRGSMLDGVAIGSAVYFVHSFAGRPSDPADRLADCLYGGHRISAAVRRENVTGAQFHPEKSSAIGLAMLARFVDA